MTDRSFGPEGEPGRGVLEAIPIPAVAMQPTINQPCSFPNYAESTPASNDSPNINFLEFGAVSAEFAQFEYTAPANWNVGRLYWAPIWSHNGAAVNFGVTWRLKAVAINNDQAISINFGNTSEVSDIGGVDDRLYFGDHDTPAPLVVGGTLRPNSHLFFNVLRVPTDGDDTMVTPARLISVTLFFRTTQRRHV